MARIARNFPRFALIASVTVLAFACGGEESEKSDSENAESDSSVSSATGGGGSSAAADASPDSSGGSGSDSGRGGTGNSEEDSGNSGGGINNGGSGGSGSSTDAGPTVDSGPRVDKDVLCETGCGSIISAGCESSPSTEACIENCEADLNPDVVAVDCSYEWELAMQCLAFTTVTCDDGNPTSAECDSLIDASRACDYEE